MKRDKITLKNMKFYGYHGVLPEEQEKGQYFFIDVEMVADLKKAGQTDNLEETIDYSRVFETVREIAENRKYRLIERLGDSISREILSTYEGIDELTIRIRKPDAPMGGELDWAEIEIKRSKNDL